MTSVFLWLSTKSPKDCVKVLAGDNAMVTNNKLNFNSSEFTHIEFSGNKVFFFGDDYYTGCEEKISLKEELKIKS